MNDYFAKVQPVPGAPGHWYGEARIRRTAKGWVVTQVHWWESRGLGKVGFRHYCRWFPTLERAERAAASLVTPRKATA